MLIVVEGPDGSGKSTFVDELSTVMMRPSDDNPTEHQRSGMQILHSGPLMQHPLVEYEWRLHDYTPDQDIIADRWHIGELIYGPLLRGSSAMTPAMKRHIDLVLFRLGAVKVFMDTPFEEVMRRIKIRGEDLIADQHMRLVWQSYHELCTIKDNWLPASHFKVDTIVETAKDLSLKARQLTRFETYVGGLTPKVLILGDVPPPIVRGRPDFRHAFMPYQGTPADFLLTALSAVDARAFGLAYAARDDVNDLWETLGQPKVICLGLDAQAYAKYRHVGDAIVSTVPSPKNAMLGMMNIHKYGDALRESIDG
jgi:energy-coupling factor transporter ATP-binding protein EcfA2